MADDKHPNLNALISQIDALSRDELTVLNKYIVERSKLLDSTSLAEAMAKFTPSDHVYFIDKHGRNREAVVVKKNKKTITLMTTGDDLKWNVSPELLTTEPQSSGAAHSNTKYTDKYSNAKHSNTKQSGIVRPDSSQLRSVIAGTTQTDTPQPSTANSNTIAFPKSGKPASAATTQAQEWVGGVITMPAFVTGEPGDDYQPTMAVWLNEIGQVIGMELQSPNSPAYDPIALLKKTITDPGAGPAGAPTHIRMNDKKLAAKLQKAFTTIQFSVAPTPELDAFANDMLDMPGNADPQTYSEITANKHLVHGFFESTAALYKCKPWKTVPHDASLIGVTAKEFGLRDAALCVIGQAGESFGILLFDSLADYDRYSMLHEAIERGVEPNIPPHRALTFEKANEIAPNVRKEIAANKWQVAAPNAYPDIIAPADSRVLRPLNEDDIELFDMIAQTLNYSLDKASFVKALGEGARQSLEYEILTSKRPATITLEAPYPYERTMKANGVADNVIAQLLVLERSSDDDGIWDRHNDLITTLCSQYSASPERHTLGTNMDSATLITQLAFNYCDCTVATMTPLTLDEIIFSIIPRKVMIGPNDAADVINDSRAFLLFLKREYGIVQADDCLAILNDGAIDRLAHALDDGGNYGIGKSVLSSTDSAAAFEQPAITSSATKPKPPSKKSRKNKRSASRKARKKNR